MNILGIDTSGPVAACAVQIDGRIVHSIQLLHGKTHSEAIMPAIDSALEASGLTPNSLDLIGVTVGPGSFTGVRIGVCAAKGLAHANDIPCVAIDSLEALAMNLYGFAGIVAPILDARRNQVYCAQFDVDWIPRTNCRRSSNRHRDLSGAASFRSADCLLRRRSGYISSIHRATDRRASNIRSFQLARYSWRSNMRLGRK